MTTEEIKKVREDQNRGEFVSIEVQPLVKEDIRVDWDMVALIERWKMNQQAGGLFKVLMMVVQIGKVSDNSQATSVVTITSWL